MTTHFGQPRRAIIACTRTQPIAGKCHSRLSESYAQDAPEAVISVIPFLGSHPNGYLFFGFRSQIGISLCQPITAGQRFVFDHHSSYHKTEEILLMIILMRRINPWKF
jgi:hypothetical protein